MRCWCVASSWIPLTALSFGVVRAPHPSCQGGLRPWSEPWRPESDGDHMWCLQTLCLSFSQSFCAPLRWHRLRESAHTRTMEVKQCDDGIVETCIAAAVAQPNVNANAS